MREIRVACTTTSSTSTASTCRSPGFTAVGIDVSDQLGGALLPFGFLVVGLSLILLTMVFRSIAVPDQGHPRLPALGRRRVRRRGRSCSSTAWFADALNVARSGPVISFMPIILMGVLFGLAMDYEVFLVSPHARGLRARRAQRRQGGSRSPDGLRVPGSARVVTAAAIIMFAVFVAFVPEGDASSSRSRSAWPSASSSTRSWCA